MYSSLAVSLSHALHTRAWKPARYPYQAQLQYSLSLTMTQPSDHKHRAARYFVLDLLTLHVVFAEWRCLSQPDLAANTGKMAAALFSKSCKCAVAAEQGTLLSWCQVFCIASAACRRASPQFACSVPLSLDASCIVECSIVVNVVWKR